MGSKDCNFQCDAQGKSHGKGKLGTETRKTKHQGASSVDITGQSKNVPRMVEQQEGSARGRVVGEVRQVMADQVLKEMGSHRGILSRGVT